MFVIGGGPAGLAAAIAARMKGFTAVIADGAEPPIDKACGEGLMPQTLRALSDLGIELGASEGFAFRGIRFHSRSDSAAVDFPKGIGLGLRRLKLHQTLIERARELGVQFLWKTPVTGICSQGVNTSLGMIRARWIVGADGIGSRVRKWTGLVDKPVHQRRYACRRHYRIQPWTDYVEIHWGESLQAYVTPLGPRDVCVVLISHDPRISFAALQRQFGDLHSRLAGGSVCGTERGAVTSSHRLSRVYRGNVALIGDASGSVDAITGEGLCLGFRQARALADALVEADLRQYDMRHRELALQPMRMARLLLLLDRHPALCRRVVRTLSAHPALFPRLLAVHAGATTPVHLASTGTRLGWRLVTT